MIDTHAKILKQQIKFDVGGDDSPNVSRATSPVNRAVSPTTIPRASYDRYPPVGPREIEEEAEDGRRLEQTGREGWLKGDAARREEEERHRLVQLGLTKKGIGPM